jgi:hypothetical protein
MPTGAADVCSWGKNGSDRRTVKPTSLIRIGPRSHLTVSRGKLCQRRSKQQTRPEKRARVTLPTYGKRYILFRELLVGRADCPFFLNLTAALMPSAGIILDL